MLSDLMHCWEFNRSSIIPWKGGFIDFIYPGGLALFHSRPPFFPVFFFARQLHSAGRVGARSSRLVYMWVCFLFNHRNGILVIYILLMGYWVDCPEGTVGERRERKRETASCLDLTVQNRRQQERAHTAGNHSTVDAGGAGWISFSFSRPVILLFFFSLFLSPPSSLSIPSLSGSHTSVYHFLCHVMCAL
ncbi:hypothetical protein M752DRAFT_49837 [Aspergillus phoenicis ATCC 13157]|nr:hypothetical protein M752DRAFT_49837 [Aspergillus phoenicis ATCC 13157]